MMASPSSTAPARRARLALLPALAVLAAGPLAARASDEVVAVAAHASDEVAPPELVAEALFLCDTLPPGGRDVNLSLALEQGEPDPVTGRTELVASPRVQLALALGPRLGLTADLGLATAGSVALDAPGASLKLLLRDPQSGARTGLSASLDLFGSTHSFADSEAGLGLGAIRTVGRLALRAAASVATGVSDWSPHLHTGLSAAVALGARWRVLGEVIADVSGGEVAFSAGPTVKATLGERTALMAGALFDVRRDAGVPAFVLQLTRSM